MPEVNYEPRMLIDGKLVEGEAGTFANINPATEEHLGKVCDASQADMHRAIDAARRAFDESDWSTDRELVLAKSDARYTELMLRSRSSGWGAMGSQ